MPIVCCAVVMLLAVGCASSGEEQADREVVTTSASGDEETAVDQIRQAGGDPKQPREIAYFLVFESGEAAEHAATDLRHQGFVVNREYTSEMGKGWLVVEKLGVVSRDLNANETLLTDVAAQHGGQYDGWEVATTP